MGPNASVDKLNYLTSSDEIFAWPDYNNVPVDLASNITQALCSQSSTATPVLPTGTSPAITSSVSVSSTTSSSISLPTTSACTGPPPTTTPPIPCQTNVIFLIDGSDGIAVDQFRKQTSFIESIFQTNWTYNEISIAIGEYLDDPSTFYAAASFGDIIKWEDVQDILKNDIHHFGGVANLTAALQKTEDPTTFTGGMGCVQKAVVLFTSTSVDTDVATAQRYADGIKKNGPLIIVAMGPNASSSKLSPLSSPTPVIQWPDYNNVPVDLANNITQALCSPSSTATSILPTGISLAVTSSAPLITATSASSSTISPPTTGLTALQKTEDPTTFTGGMGCVQKAVVLFTSTSNVFAIFNRNSSTTHSYFASNHISCTDEYAFILSACHHSIAIIDIRTNNSSVHGALQKTEDPTTFTGGMGCVQKAVVLFTSTSVDADVATAQQYADGIKKNGPLIIVAMGPNASVSKLSSLSSPTPVIQWLDYNNVPANLATNITQAMCSASSTAIPIS
uniref:VWFA domain-containing protein n=1 Tax=Plectus sambesii TaxID=2011161 RepID=A0A914XEQ3_9BILA